MTNAILRLRFPLVVLAAVVTRPTDLQAQRSAKPSVLSGADAYIEKAIRDWQVPGLAIAVVKDDSVVLAKGYGVRELGKPEPVDDQTLFAIGSCSKAFGSATMAMLVQDGKVDWDDRARQYLPWLELWDPWVTNEVRIRDLLAHRVGSFVGIENRLRGFTSSYRDWIRRSRFIQPMAPFRDRYVYSNLMFIVAGELVKSASGAASWNEFAQERIWTPLGMTRTTANIHAAQRTRNKVSPHIVIDGKLQPVDWELDADSLANPTGGVNSTARDMAQWIRFQLGEGRYAGRELLRPEIFREMHTLMRPVGNGARREGSAGYVEEVGARFMGYGLGWIIQDYRGRKMVHHGGSAPGQTCWVGLLPEERLGVYVGVSATRWLPEALMYWVFDQYLGEPRRDWSAIRLATTRAGDEAVRQEDERRDQARVNGTRPTVPLEGYAGVYDDGGAYGPATVRVENGRLTVEIGRLTAALEHWHYDTFLIPAYTWFRPADPPDTGRTRTFYPVGLGRRMFVTFVLDPSTRAVELQIEDIARFRRVR